MGSPISVDGNDAFFYVPLLYNGEFVYIVCLCETGDSNTPYAMTYGRMFSDELNNLPNGNYRFVVSNERVFVVGDEITIQVYGPTDDYIEDLSEQENYVQKPTFDKVDILLLKAVELTEINNYMTLPISTRGITSKSLSIPYVANGGKFGYCWLSAPTSLILYYGRSVDLINAHTTMHGYAHTRYDCPGGSLQESYGVLNIYGGVTGTVIGATRTWGQVMDSINNSSPLLTGWGRYQNNSRIAGHAMVICGYSFNDTALTITYTIRDSYSTSYTYVTTPISATTVYYVIGGYNYKWDCTIYDIY